ncbi:dnaJ homolog subfamily C member 13-like isoform X2 [Clavelina lepadiformis]|uniref:dnaJ homolog subfamily C member 13-like isoform X2 n=1 Tax=Clavelina lepadiformis TaxID=159417 RepID=UPI0040422B45
MSQIIADNVDVACYYTTKHSWRGKYKRLFAVGTKGITTYNPNTLEVTNQWPYNEFAGIIADSKAKNNNEFVISLRKTGKKNDTMRFSCDCRADVITEALRYCKHFSENYHKVTRFNARKHHWSDTNVSIVLEVGAGSLHQLNSSGTKILASYDYKDIEGFTEVSGFPGGIAVIYTFNRLHLFSCSQSVELIKACVDAAARNIGITIKKRKEAISFDQFVNYRFGDFSSDEHITSVTEFQVQKLTHRSQDPVRRTLCLSEACILERDPATYSIITLRPLSEIFSLVRSSQNPQLFIIEYCRGQVRRYLSTDRDSLLATLLDGVRASGNRDVCIKMQQTDLGQRVGPLYIPVEEEVESMHLKFLVQPPTGNFTDALFRFNNCIQYSGLLWSVKQDGFFTENKEKMINGAITALLDKEGDQDMISEHELQAQFHALRRLVASKAGFIAFTQLPRFRENLGVKVIKALQRDSDAVTHAAIDMIVALLCPMHDNYDLRQEQLNKASLLSSKTFLEALLNKLEDRVLKGCGALVINAMLDFLTFALCAPHSETTEGKCFDQLLQLVADLGRCLFRLFQHPSMAIVKGAGLVMKAIIEEGDSETAAHMQGLALAEGALPRHLHTSMFTTSVDTRVLTNRQLSQHLIGLWVTGHPPAMALLKRIMPAGLLAYLESDEDVPENEKDLLHIRDNLKSAIDQTKGQTKWRQVDKQLKQVERLVRKQTSQLMTHWRDQMGLKQVDTNQQKPIVLRKRRQRIKSEANWPLFYYQFSLDHAKPNLIWNHKTREELRDALENEMRAFQIDKELGLKTEISWNYTEFEMLYECLSDEIKIGDYYLRLLLEEEFEDSLIIKRSYEFYNDLYHRFLLTAKSAMKCMCLQAMAIVYGKYWEDIGPFHDTKYMMGMLERCADRMERDRLVLFVEKLIKHKQNAKEIIDANGIKILVDLMSLAHLHVTRAHVPTQRNVIEATPEMMAGASEKEWYFGNKERERLGPYSFQEMKDFWEDGTLTAKSRCWAQGMDGWRPLHLVTQLKWTLMASGQAVMNETDLSITILNILISICRMYPSKDENNAVIRPLPRIRRLLGEAICFPHCVQLLLTFDPILVEKVATLALHVMEDNPTLSRVYLTGVFFFILMYTGSNVLPIVKFLQYLHLKQAFRSEQQTSDMLAQSILGSILPEAMIHYLENYGSEKFSETFLGEFDTPEAIWNSEMRRYMIEKIAAHIADFSPRLMSNIRALYQYVPIPAISFPQLEDELFCNIYYLRHLCDETKFPEWPIKKPVEFLKDILATWKKEVEKKAPKMSYNEAYDVLRMPRDKAPFHESQIRKAYFRMAQKYHPDKNPEGREIFEAVNKAYEFLCSKKKRVIDGPDPRNVLLVLKAQSILFRRYKEELSPYKYAGYPALIKTIVMEKDDDQLFSKEEPLLAEAVELAYHTVNCSALNAEELRRESGIEILQSSLSRCVSMLTQSSKPGDLAVRVCANICRCYAVSAQFEECREKFMNDATIIQDLCRMLFYKNLPRLCIVATECVSAFAIDIALQTQLFKAGVLWHLLLFLFNYDFTLEEGGVQKNEKSNQQEVANRLARLSINALAYLGGYMAPDSTNLLVHKSVCALITPYLTKQLTLGKYDEVLKILNSNTENPYLMWDNSTRFELTSYLKDQQQKHVRTGVCDPSYGAEFVFSLHSKELIVGDIFVRIYNEQPTFPVEDPRFFAQKLIDFLGSQAENNHNSQKNSVPIMSHENTKNCLAALKALSNVMKNHSETATVCIGHFKLIFSLLRVENASEMQLMALEVLSSVTSNKMCVENIADSRVVTLLLLTLESLPAGCPTVLEVLHALASNPKIVKEMLQQGGLLYMLNLFCNSPNPEVRQQTAELFAKLASDKLNGPKVRIFLSKFLPTIFMDAMRDSPEASVHMFEGTHENPELIWNDESRKKVSMSVKKITRDLFKQQAVNPELSWNFPPNFVSVFDVDDSNEIMVGGVYLRLFIAQPGWVLRNPREFTVEIMNALSELVASSNPPGEKLETVTQAACCLFTTQPALAEHIPALGHLPILFKSMMGKNDAVHKSCISVIHVISNCESCVHAFASTDCIKPLMNAMKSRPDQADRACEALHHMFAKDQSPQLMSQVMKTGLIPYLLHLLEGSSLRGVKNVQSVKAQIVKSLKAMMRSMEFGERIQKELEGSSVWAAYKDQMHDLFISDAPVAGYLTGGPTVAGYLTAAPPKNMPQAPPPVEE